MQIISHNTYFKDFVHVVGNFSGSKKLLWDIIGNIKADFTHDDPNCKPKFEQIYRNIMQNLTRQSPTPVNTEYPSNELLGMAGKMFIYIQTNPRDVYCLGPIHLAK